MPVEVVVNSRVETLDSSGVIRHGKPDRHQDFGPYVVREAKDGLDHLFCPTCDFANTDPQGGGGNSDVAGRGAGVEPGDDLNTSGPHDLRGLIEVAADNDYRWCVVHKTRTGMPDRPHQPRIGDNDQMPDTGTGYLSPAGRVDQSIKDRAAWKFGSENPVHPTKTHGFEHVFHRAATAVADACGHRQPFYNCPTSPLRHNIAEAQTRPASFLVMAVAGFASPTLGAWSRNPEEAQVPPLTVNLPNLRNHPACS